MSPKALQLSPLSLQSRSDSQPRRPTCYPQNSSQTRRAKTRAPTRTIRRWHGQGSVVSPPWRGPWRVRTADPRTRGSGRRCTAWPKRWTRAWRPSCASTPGVPRSCCSSGIGALRSLRGLVSWSSKKDAGEGFCIGVDVVCYVHGLILDGLE